MRIHSPDGRERGADQTFIVEVVWDAGLDVTAIPAGTDGEGTALEIGPHGGWLPPHLVALAGTVCFLNALLRLADTAGVSIVGYVSRSSLRVPADPRALPSLTVVPCIVVTSEEAGGRIGQLCRIACDAANVSGTLVERLDVIPETQIIQANDEESTT